MLAHGYPESVRARLPLVPRAADNAAAAAYRTGQLQIVTPRAGGPHGALVAPIICAEGCIGALSAELGPGSDVSADAQAIAAIVAAQLSGVLAANLDAAAPPTQAAVSQ